MKKLGEVLLPEGMWWRDRYDAAPVHQTVVHTLGGKPVIWAAQQPEGIPVTLVAQPEAAWLDLATVKALAAMASQANASFILIWEEWQGNVMFRHHDPPALTMTPLWPKKELFTGQIKLMRY